MSVLDKFSLENKVAVVSGGEGLLGKLICHTIRELGGKAISVDLVSTADHVVDITDGHKVHTLAETLGQEDILVNAAIGNQKPLRDVGQGFGSDLNIGLVGALNMTAAFGSKMQERKHGVILNIGSDLSFIAPDGGLYPPSTNKPVSYSVVKHGIIGLTRYFAALWPHVRCNCLCPGGIDVGQSVPHLPMGRLARLDEMAGPVAFMLSEASSYMTGACVTVDGGRTII